MFAVSVNNIVNTDTDHKLCLISKEQNHRERNVTSMEKPMRNIQQMRTPRVNSIVTTDTHARTHTHTHTHTQRVPGTRPTAATPHGPKGSEAESTGYIQKHTEKTQHESGATFPQRSLNN